MKRIILSTVLAVASFAAVANDYYLVTPVKGRTAASAHVEPISVSLSGVSLPDGIAGSPYVGFDFKSALVVTGDPHYTGSGVAWSVAAGSLPAGVVLNGDGTISGQPTSPGRSTFTLSATYQNKAGQQAYDLLVARRTAGINLAGLLANYPLSTDAVPVSSGIALTAYGAPVFSTTSKPSASFSGAADLRPTSGYANYGTGVVSGAGDVSVGAWVRTTFTGTERVVQQRSNGDNTVTINGQFVTQIAAGKFCYLDGSNLAFGATVCHSATVNDGNWHHVGFMRPAAGGVRLFVDGVGQSFSYPLRNYQIRPGLTIGYDQRDNSAGFAGGIADVWLFGRALSDAEFRQAYTSMAPIQ